MRLSENLRNLRTQRHLTQKAVADAINISSVSVQNYENATRNPPLNTLIALADFYNVSLDYLVGREFAPAQPPPDSLEARVQRLESLLGRKEEP